MLLKTKTYDYVTLKRYEFVTERGGEMVKVPAEGVNIAAALLSAGLEWKEVVTYKYL